MMVLYSSGDVVEEVGGYDEGVEDAAAAVETDEGELVGEADGEGDMVAEREAEEEVPGYEGEGVAGDGDEVVEKRSDSV